MIYALVLIVMALQVTWDKALMESTILTRDQNRGIVSENRAKLRFSYRLRISTNPSDVSGISGVISFKKIDVLESDAWCSCKGIIIFVDRCNLVFRHIKS